MLIPTVKSTMESWNRLLSHIGKKQQPAKQSEPIHSPVGSTSDSVQTVPVVTQVPDSLKPMSEILDLKRDLLATVDIMKTLKFDEATNALLFSEVESLTTEDLMKGRGIELVQKFVNCCDKYAKSAANDSPELNLLIFLLGVVSKELSSVSKNLSTTRQELEVIRSELQSVRAEGEATSKLLVDANEHLIKANEGLTKRLTDVEDEMKRQQSAALLKQLAINIEYEFKLECLKLMSAADRNKYLDKRGNVKEKSVVNAELVEFEDLLPSDCVDYELFYSAATYRSSDNVDCQSTISGALKMMKRGNLSFAHHTMIGGRDVTYLDCVQLVHASDLNEAQKREILYQLLQLKDVRLKNAQTEFLCA